MIALRSILHPARDEEALQRGMEQDVVAGVPESVVEELKALGIPEGSYRFAPLSMAQRSAARRLTASFRDVPHFSLASRVEVDRLAALREGFPRGADGVRPTFNDLIIKAAALALQAVPEANASFTEKGLVFHAAADIAVAVALPDGGLVTPIVPTAPGIPGIGFLTRWPQWMRSPLVQTCSVPKPATTRTHCPGAK